ncbi:MAG: D-alanyl-D-alanine carboxypeptidase/D-alanyl-D-alanine-endopeptidase [Acidobacteria bacterium]|nr:D-alanyl-D-alanine carboxypeptidase/D-alanyl-D-alanine-endopeptidase [Acidobacteriota bacterium]
MRSILLVAVALSPVCAADLAERIGQVIDESEAGRRTRWGIHAVALGTGTVLYERNAGQYFTPASNTKLFATSLALARLGGGHRFKTELRLAGPDLVLVGGGDPSLSARQYPYSKDRTARDPLAVVEAMADAVARAGIERIAGDVVGDDRWYPFEPVPEAWSQGDLMWAYGAAVSALTVNDGAQMVTVRPHADGFASIGLRPAVEYFEIDNRVTVTAGGQRAIDWDLRGRHLRISGVLPSNDRGESQSIAVDDPALFAAHTLAVALTRRGVAIGGRVRARHRAKGEPWEAPAGQLIWHRESPPLAEVAQVVNKVSQNLHAELLLHEVGKVKRLDGTREAAMEELEGFLVEMGAGKREFDLHDGSGLARANLVSPLVTTRLLAHMDGSPEREAFLASLAIGGTDGTIENRFGKNRRGKLIRAKTGSLSHVSCLAGYAESETHGRVAFAIMANGYTAPSAEIRALIDKIGLILTE